MDAMRADMGGAATVCASVVTAAALKLPINIIGKIFNHIDHSISIAHYQCKCFIYK